MEQAAEDDEYFAVPWENHQWGTDGADVVVSRAISESKKRSATTNVNDIARDAAKINPFVYRYMVQVEFDPMFVRSFQSPKFTYAEEEEFIRFIEDQDEESLQKRGRRLKMSERSAAEYGFFEDWSNRHSLNPISSSAAHASEITSAPAVVIVTPVIDNKDNIFYFKDFSSELVKASSVGGCTSYKKAVPVCSLACSVSVDVLGLMHERTGHFNKRGLIECVKSKIVSGLKI